MKKKVIWKFAIRPADRLGVEMPRGAEILSVQVMGGDPYLWALVDPEGEKELREFRLLPTGALFDPANLRFCGTFQIAAAGSLVFHLFEISHQV